MRILGHKPTVTAWIGMAIIVVNLLVAIFGPVFAPYAESQTVGATWDEPSMQMLLGADQIGRDMLTRLIYGARMTIGVALATTALSFFIGITLGFAAAVLGGWVDTVISRLVDVILSIPLLILALIILGVFGSSIPVLIITIAVLDSTRVFRLSRALGMNLTVLEYVEAARLRGEGTWWIIRREILPNASAPLLSEFGLRFCFNFLFIAALSFLGLGIQPPFADWGGMVRENSAAINFGMLAPIWPALAITVLTVGVNMVVDWLLSVEARPSGAQAEL
ncbi:MAG TPA: ABC transporter permease [Burkholderiaceae bacterium]|nr:ABC transporter permease [Burkholderiaceae bacterium]